MFRASTAALSSISASKEPAATLSKNVFHSRIIPNGTSKHASLPALSVVNQEQVVSAANRAFASAERFLLHQNRFYDQGIYRNLKNTLEPVLELCRAYESQPGVSRDEIKALRKSVRAIAFDLVKTGPFGREISLWPRGPGSSTAMKFVYEGLENLPTYNSKAHYMDWWLRDQDLAHAVRCRKETLRDIMSEELSSLGEKSSGDIHVLDLANGPIQSLKEILMSGRLEDSTIRRIKYTGFDTDAKVQRANKDWVEEFGDPLEQESFQFVEGSAMSAPFNDKDDKYGMIYSTGFFDYLPDDRLVKLWQDSYEALMAGGSLIIYLKDADRYQSQSYHYFVRWDQFFQRSAEHFEYLLEQSGMPQPEQFIRDSTGIILFYVVRKPE